MEERGYTVLRCIGQGAQGRVYEVQDKHGKPFVLKQLPWIGEGDKEKAQQEVRVLASLRHPCIVPYIDSFLARSMACIPTEDTLCLVMARCEHDLRRECLQRSENGDRLSEELVLSWLTQLCWGLQHLHARRFLHRDLKPQNVLVTKTGRMLLADFGVVGHLEHTEDFKNSIVGTPSFMSPEMLMGRPYGRKTDQWALGCILYEIMALEPPFAKCGCYAAIMQAVLNAQCHTAPPGYSQELSSTLEALMAKQPDSRPSSAELLGGSLLNASFQTLLHTVSDEIRELNMSPRAGDDASSYASDFESYSGSETGSLPAIPEGVERTDEIFEPPPGSVGMDEWRHCRAEAQTLLRPQSVIMDPLEEARKARRLLRRNLGSTDQVNKALRFLRERRPIGETDDVDELVLQIEVMDMLGDCGLHALPLLERCLAMERLGGVSTGSGVISRGSTSSVL